ncbi:hypothetical protein SPI_06076 [Niveomyces insectorum RCEF 264]|uniref:Uncharacterized protein n=1 Tax=Niveomyces insectorum RCEF 264 TaxID=1081102 RepID=A0A167SS27_9HYPO|nr:hypothetical protein SPI_06076 [Niveomyces insectorum RCEF 264]
MNAARDPTSRLRANLNPLRTSSLGGVGGFHGPAGGTPLSAVSLVSHSGLSLNQTPLSAIQPYNPQEWVPSPAQERGHHQEQQSSPSLPPPPYSPPRSQRPVSMIYESPPANTSAARAPLPVSQQQHQQQQHQQQPHQQQPHQQQQQQQQQQHHHHHHHYQQQQQRPSPEQPVNQTFAPPPGTSRGGSRERRFGLPSFGRRRDAEQQHAVNKSPSDMQHHHQHQQHHCPQPLQLPPPPSRSPQPLPTNNAASRSDAPPHHRHPTLEPLQIPANTNAHADNMAPPSARRAASTSAIETPTSARSRSSSQVRWETAGAAVGHLSVPPPPPGPPPPASSARSQSMNRSYIGTGSSSEPVVSPPTRRPPPAGVAVLGPVPPTPAGWIEERTPRQAPDGISTPPSTAVTAAAAATEDEPLNRVSLVESISSAASSHDNKTNDSVVVSSCSTSSSHSPNQANTSTHTNMLVRTGAVRGEKTLRERRNESRTRSSSVRQSLDGSASASLDASGCPLSNIVIPGSGSVGSLMRRPTITKSTPRSGGGGPNSGVHSGRSLRDASPQNGDKTTPTPPFSPYPPGMKPRPQLLSISTTDVPHTGGDAHVPKALPTPPPQSRSASSSQTRYSADTPGAAAPVDSPFTRKDSAIAADSLSKDMAVHQTAEQFSQGTIDRFIAFAQSEAAAGADADRVRLFAEFVVSESRIRRERYAAAIGAMGSEIFDLTRDLFRPMAAQQRSSLMSRGSTVDAFTPQSSEPGVRSHRGSGSSLFRDGPASAPPVSTAYTKLAVDTAPASAGIDFRAGSSSGSNDNNGIATNTIPMSPTGTPVGWQQQSNYMPSLSPILSMSVSEHHDDGDSRGRPASRWWESSSHGGGDGPGRLERSKRESKYMGVPKEAREALQWIDDPEPLSGKSVIRARSGDNGCSSSNSNAYDGYGGYNSGGGSSSQNAIDYIAYEASGEYPPEKAPLVSGSGGGPDTPRDPLHTPHAQVPFRNSLLGPASASASASATGSTASATGLMTPSAPNTPSANQLDVSRLVTLPPPYPRHHPAVNNNHPELATIRATVRTLTDMAEVEAAQARFKGESQAASEAAEQASQRETQAMRANLQAEIVAGRMSYAEAAAIEADTEETRKTRSKERDKADFDRFQTTVVMPVNGLLTGRIAKATQLLDDLQGRLFVDTSSQASPNLPQEEGDEQPELLEKLTLLKWIFEAREALHRAIYDLLSDRNNRYRDMVLTPYRLAGNQAKIRDAEAFFADDAATRAAAFAQDALTRMLAFRDVVEATVVRGVEVQLSAFWDLAPPLSELLEQVPLDDLAHFSIRIPSAEIAETPSYRAHPLQYLFSLLLHAEKSTHQFIESQTNLLCLLHEVKEAAVTATARVRALDANNHRDGVAAAPDTTSTETDADDAAERARLTADLQDKVRVVQDQWRAGLGDRIVLVKERVGGWLLETGGWDESLEEGGVGSV